jgi:hypothetical protein
MLASIVISLLAVDQDSSSLKAPSRSAADGLATASSSEVEHASRFFATLLGSGELDEEDADLVGRLDAAVRDARQLRLDRIAGWKGPGRPTAAEAERFASVAPGHAEAIVLRAVLTQRQSRRWRAEAARLAPPAPLERYPLTPMLWFHVPPAESLAEAQSQILLAAMNLMGEGRFASDLFWAAIESDGKALPGLEPRQFELLRRLDRLAREVQRSWLRRGIGEYPPPEGLAFGPPSPAMLERLSERAVKLRADIVARFETIALEVVLDPDQAEAAKRLMWRRLGVYALVDPELARRLVVSKAQRDRIVEFLKGRPDDVQEIFHRCGEPGMAALNEFLKGKKSSQQVDLIRAEGDRRCLEETARYDERCWSILHHDQRRKLDEILKDARQRAEAARQPAVIDD